MNFESSDCSPLQQGHLDGLCGVYSIVNYFRRRLGLHEGRDRRRIRQIFRIALENLNTSRTVDIDSIMNGYRQGQLKRAFEAVEEKLGIGVRAKTISSYAAHAKVASIFELIATLDEGEAALVRLREPNHWVLGFSGSKRQFWIDDSAYGGARRAIRSTSVAIKKIELRRGLVFLNA